MTECYECSKLAELVAENSQLRSKVKYDSHGWSKANMGWADANAEAEKWRQKYHELRAKLDEMADRKCPGYDPELHHCRYHHQDFELNHQTVSRLKRENAELARDLGECMAERDGLIAEIDALEYRGELDEPRGTLVDMDGEVLE